MLFALLSVVICASIASNPYEGDKDLWRKTLSSSTLFSGKPFAGHWASRGYALPHEALRRELFLAKRVLNGSFDPTIDWHVKSFFDWFRFVDPFVHGHHWAEETIVFPAIINATGAELPPQMAADHETLLNALHSVAGYETKLQNAAGNEQQLKQLTAELRKTYNELYDMMGRHLNEEEDILVPMIQKYFTEEQFEHIIDTIIARTPPLTLLWEIPPMISWLPGWCHSGVGCPDNIYSVLESKLPAPIRFLANNIFIPRWEAATQSLKGIEIGQHIPYHRYIPLRNERLALIVVFVLLYTIVALVRRLLCGSRKSATEVSKKKKE